MKNLESWGVPEQVFVDREGNTWLSVAGEGCYRYKEGGKSLLPEHEADRDLPLKGGIQQDGTIQIGRASCRERV